MSIRNDATEMAKRLLVDSIWKSANLEGLGTSFQKVEMILENIPVDTSKEEVLFIVNMKRAWEFLLENIDYRNCFQFIRELNKIVGNNLFYGAGVVRTLGVSIGGTTWKPSMPNELDIIHSIEEIGGIKDAGLRALTYFCFLTRSQIFIDGNKRVAQLMTNKILIENNIGIFQVPINEVNRFKTLLLKFYESNNSAELISFMYKYCINMV